MGDLSPAKKDRKSCRSKQVPNENAPLPPKGRAHHRWSPNRQNECREYRWKMGRLEQPLLRRQLRHSLPPPKEDPWNSIIAGATIGGLLQIRMGLRSIVGGAIICVGRPLDIAGLPGSGTTILDQTVLVPDIQTKELNTEWFQRSKELKKEGVGDNETKIPESLNAPPYAHL